MATHAVNIAGLAKTLDTGRGHIINHKLGSQLKRVTTPDMRVNAGLTKRGNILLITGSKGVKDYMFYNLRPNRFLPKMGALDQLTKHIPRNAYHRGFLLHAARVLEFLEGEKPSFIAGHSLGAASAQILGTALKVPTVCFASPQVIKPSYLEKTSFRSKRHAQWNVFNLAWKQDFVTKGYRKLGYRSLGHRVVVDFNKPNLGIDHFMSDYRKLILVDTHSTSPKLPTRWPDPNFKHPTHLA